MKPRKALSKILSKSSVNYTLLILMLAIMLSPIIFTAMTSFKPREETFRWPPTYFPETFTLEAYREVIFDSPMPRHLLNSLVVSGGTTVIVMVGSIFTAWGLSRYRFKGSAIFLFIFIATRIMPPISLLVPFYIIMSYLGLINTYLR